MDSLSSTRLKLIQLLSIQEDKYISGQLLSEKLGISRSAVWKHMNELKKDGYEIEAKAKKGYRIIENATKVSGNTIVWGLETNWLGKRLVHKDTMTSTQRYAHQLALDGAKHGTIVLADEQTEGRGRMDRTWHSEKGKGIWMSMILRPDILPSIAPQLTLLTATVLAEVIDEYIGIRPQIKWPNDMLIRGKKIAGILTEMQVEQDQVSYVIIGTGINVNQLEGDIPPELSNRASSIQIETKQDWELLPLIQHILQTFEIKYHIFLEQGFPALKTTWENYGFRMNESLEIKTGLETWQGVFLGIAEDGALLARQSDGKIEKVYSAEISWFRGEK